MFHQRLNLLIASIQYADTLILIIALWKGGSRKPEVRNTGRPAGEGGGDVCQLSKFYAFSRALSQHVTPFRLYVSISVNSNLS